MTDRDSSGSFGTARAGLSPWSFPRHPRMTPPRGTAGPSPRAGLDPHHGRSGRHTIVCLPAQNPLPTLPSVPRRGLSENQLVQTCPLRRALVYEYEAHEYDGHEPGGPEGRLRRGGNRDES